MTMPRWTLDELVAAYVMRALRRAPSLSEAARRLGMHRRSLQRWLNKRGIQRRRLNAKKSVSRRRAGGNG